METIFAVSSGAPPAAIAIVRISGAQAVAAATVLAGTLPPARKAGLRALRDKDGMVLDRALLLFFPAPDTATGEDVVELHVHGGRAVVRAVDAALGALPGMRRAEPGEFTERAFLNDKLDLAQAEAVADLIDASTEAAARSAARSLAGRVAAKSMTPFSTAPRAA